MHCKINIWLRDDSRYRRTVKLRNLDSGRTDRT
jgi:hypothetical protein